MFKRLGVFTVILLVAMTQLTVGKTAKKKRVIPQPRVSTEKLVDPAAAKAALAQVLLEQPGYVATLGELDAEAHVALALYQTRHAAIARSHLSHGDAIIHRRLLNRVLARRAQGFSAELKAFTKAIERGESFKSVQKNYVALEAAIAASRGKGDLVKAVSMVTATGLLIGRSADYYSSGVGNGKIIDQSQYQDAWGFMKAAKNIMADISKSEKAKHAEEMVQLDSALANLNALWPNLTDGDANRDGGQILSDAAVRVNEILTRLQSQ